MVETLGEAPWAPAWVAWAPQSSLSTGQSTGPALQCIKTSNKYLLRDSTAGDPSRQRFWPALGGLVLELGGQGISTDESVSLHVRK